MLMEGVSANVSFSDGMVFNFVLGLYLYFHSLTIQASTRIYSVGARRRAMQLPVSSAYMAISDEFWAGMPLWLSCVGEHFYS